MGQTIDKAIQYAKNYYNLPHPTKEDDFIIHETGDSRYMMELGGWYYSHKQFDLAEEYYLLVAELHNPDAYGGLGYIYYYGRTGKPDYEKAFKYYALGYQSDRVESGYKLSDTQVIRTIFNWMESIMKIPMISLNVPL